MNMNQNTSHWDAIVVGAGLGGMSCAAHLCALGKRTLLLERHSIMGGSSHVFRRGKEWQFECGVHYQGDCGPGGLLPTMMRGLGLEGKVEWVPMEQDGFDTIIGPGLEFKVPVGWDNYLESLLATFPGEEKGLRYYVKVLRRIGEGMDRSTEVSSASGLLRMLRRAGWASPWMLAPHAALLVACRLKPSTMLALSVEDGALVTLPQQLPVVMVAGFLRDYVEGGSWFPKGGGQIYSAAFAEVIQTHGGSIRTQAEVTSIDVEAGRVTGVTLVDGERLTAPVVVAAGDIKRSYRDLVGYDKLPRSLSRRCENWKMSNPLINAYFGIEIDIQNTPNTNYFSIPNWDDTTSLLNLHKRSTARTTKAAGRDPVEWAQDFARNVPGFVHCATRRDPTNPFSAPPGHAAIEVQTIAPAVPELWGYAGHDTSKNRYRREAQYQEIKEIITAGMLDRVEQAFPGAASKVKWAELGTPATQERFTHTSDGSAFGIEPNYKQIGPFFRPKSTTAIKGLFLAGASTVWGPATIGAMLSGLHAASAITGRDLQTEIREGKVLADKSRFSQWAENFDPYKATRMLGREDKGRAPSPAQEEKVNAAPLKLAAA